MLRRCLQNIISSNLRHSTRQLSYVSRIRLLQRLKEDSGFCKEQLGAGQFLLYSKVLKGASRIYKTHFAGKNLSLMNYPNGSVNCIWLVRPPDDSGGISLKSENTPF